MRNVFAAIVVNDFGEFSFGGVDHILEDVAEEGDQDVECDDHENEGGEEHHHILHQINQHFVSKVVAIRLRNFELDGPEWNHHHRLNALAPAGVYSRVALLCEHQIKQCP